ncbi:unnamed protein product [Aphanomyces euteiches]|uniref:SAM-dependent MTase RsmB/NOP-type domain-containing protein n=1 Tax=Aphanomyces euteiches TaxID=100861 RepID=A0A6G0WJZ7_9STRA|nr:hypothetical protein Ae201684_014416 [Aphanomyces euteiches]KAH9158170.1 hypothetical protein AeRB84_000003 [Aphanomyces euteiches]
MTKSKDEALAEFKQAFREYLVHANVASGEKMDALMACLAQPLPICFRINLDGLESERLKTLLSTTFQFPRETYFHNDVAITPPEPLAWYPQDKTAWQVACGRVAFSKAAHVAGPVQDFHKLLLAHTEYGNIDRQEAVSMLPVLLLDVQAGHKVLDMCASPGSKTTQILDLVHDGMVVANDMNKKRAYMLVHRLSRNTLQSAVVTCSPGQEFPGLYDVSTGALQSTNAFDRVLCDVPCSGDGTLRKSQALWKEWHIGQGLTLFPTQLALALRGAALLKVGGTMVYSTCSFNPIEDEAVVAELLRRSDGALEGVDPDGKLPGLQYRPGRVAWSVGWRSKSKSHGKGHVLKKVDATDEFHVWFDDYNEVPTQLQGDRILRCMFPPTEASTQAVLRRTMRLVPTDQDSGGFFIAILRKTKELPGVNQSGLDPLDEVQTGLPPPGYICKLCQGAGHYMKHCELFDAAAYDNSTTDEPTTKKAKMDENAIADKSAEGSKKDEPYRRITDDVWAALTSFYGIAENSSLRTQLWSRSDSSAQINYVQDAIAATCLAGDALSVVNTGLKVFSKTSDGFFRPTSEGLASLRSHLTKRLLAFSLADFKVLVERTDAVPFSALNDLVADESTKKLAELPLGPAIGMLLKPASMGSLDEKTWTLLQERLLCNLWLGKGSFMPRLSAVKRAEMTELLTAYLDN